jgi:hypothetical protein
MARHLFTTVATVPVTPAGLMDEAVRESLIVPVFLRGVGPVTSCARPPRDLDTRVEVR